MVAVNTRALAITLGINSSIAAGCLLLFTALRALKGLRLFYAPKRYAQPGEWGEDAHSQHARPPRLSRAPPLFLLQLWRLPEAEVLRCAGPDAAVYLRIMRMGFTLFLLLSVWCCGVVLPVNATGREVERLMRTPAQRDQLLRSSDLRSPGSNETVSSRYTLTDFDRLSMANIPPGSPKLWLHLASVFVVVGLTLQVLASHSREVVALRLLYLTHAPRGGPSHTVLLTDIPGIEYGTKQQRWRHWLLTRTPLRFLPARAKAWLLAQGREAAEGAAWGVSAVGGLAGRYLGVIDSLLARKGSSTGADRARDPSPALSTASGASSPGLPLLRGRKSSSGHGTAPPPGTQLTCPSSSDDEDAYQDEDPSDIDAGPNDGLQALPGGLPTPPRTPTAAAAEAAGQAQHASAAAPIPSDETRTGATAFAHPYAAVFPAPLGAGVQAALPSSMSPEPASAGAPKQSRVNEAAAGPSAAQQSAASSGSAKAQQQGPVALPGLTSRVDVPEGSSAEDVLRRLNAWARAEALLGQGASVEAMVGAELGRMLPGARLAAVQVLRDERHLAPAAQAYMSTAQQAEDLLDHYAARLAAGKRVARRKVRVVGALHGEWAADVYGLRPVRVDALSFSRLALVHRWRELQARRAELPQQPHLPAAFVTFQRRWHQAVASSSLLHHDTTVWRCQGAPEPREVLWPNLGLRLWERQARTTASRSLYALLLLTYAIPVSALQALLQLNRLERMHGLRWLLNLPLMRPLLGGILPGLVLRLVVLTMPYLLAPLVARTGVVSLSAADFAVTTLNFNFQVVAVFISSFVAGALLNQVTALLNNPSSILNVLGTGAPQTATFFITYILFNALVLKPIFLLRLPQLAWFWLRYSLAGTRRARRRLWERQVCNFGPSVPDLTITLLLGLVFSIIQPVILPVCVLYFGVVRLTEGHQQMYVWRRQYESGGRMWAQVFTQVMVGLYVFLAVMAGLLAVKRFPFAPLVLLPLAATVSFHMRLRALLARPWEVLSLSDAAALDAADDAEQEVAHQGQLAARGRQDQQKKRGDGAGDGVAERAPAAALEPAGAAQALGGAGGEAGSGADGRRASPMAPAASTHIDIAGSAELGPLPPAVPRPASATAAAASPGPESPRQAPPERPPPQHQGPASGLLYVSPAHRFSASQHARLLAEVDAMEQRLRVASALEPQRPPTPDVAGAGGGLLQALGSKRLMSLRRRGT